MTVQRIIRILSRRYLPWYDCTVLFQGRLRLDVRNSFLPGKGCETLAQAAGAVMESLSLGAFKTMWVSSGLGSDGGTVGLMVLEGFSHPSNSV